MDLLPLHAEGDGLCKQEEVDQREAELIDIAADLLAAGEGGDRTRGFDAQGDEGLLDGRGAFLPKHEADHLQIIRLAQALVVHWTEGFKILVCKEGDDRHELVVVVHGEKKLQALCINGE